MAYPSVFIIELIAHRKQTTILFMRFRHYKWWVTFLQKSGPHTGVYGPTSCGSQRLPIVCHLGLLFYPAGNGGTTRQEVNASRELRYGQLGGTGGPFAQYLTGKGTYL